MSDMLKKEQFKVFGSYCQQFMYIILRAPEHNVLFHEYIHHLQNVTTYYSINTFLCLKSLYYDYIIRSKKWDDSFLRNKMYSLNLLFLYETLGERIDRNFEKVRICNVHFNEKNNHITSLELDLLIDNDPQIIKYKLGTIAIKECMARIIEKAYYPDKISNSLTYYICELLIYYICPNLINNEIAIVAILELSLMSASPIEMILDLLLNIRRKDINEITPKSIYDIAYSFKCIAVDQDGKESNTILMDSYSNIYEMIDEVLDTFYNLFSDADGNIFVPFKDWQKNVLKNSFSIRKENPLLLTSMLETNVYTDHSNIIASFLIKMPPIVYGNYQALDFTDEVVKGRLIMFLAEEEVFKNLYSGINKSCNLKEICKKYVKYAGKGITKNPSIYGASTSYEYMNKLQSVYNENLCEKPTKRPLNEYLCPFTILWRKIENM